LGNIDISSTHSTNVHKLRSGQNDDIHYPFSLPFGIDTSSPIEIKLSYSANQAINTADLQLDLRMVSHTNGTVNNTQTSDRIVTQSQNIVAAEKVETVTFFTDYYVSDYLESDIMFIQLKRTDNNGGEVYPIELCINYPIYKIGKLDC